MKRSLFLLITFVVVFGGWKLIRDKKNVLDEASIPIQRALHVNVVMPKIGEIKPKFSYIGQLKPEKSVQLSTRYSGLIQSLDVYEGKSVRKGDILLSIDATELESKIVTFSLKQKELEVQKNNAILEETIARKKHTSNQKLFNAGAISEEFLDESALMLDKTSTKRSGIEQSLAQVITEREALLQSRVYYTIQAPMDGIVEKVWVEKGETSIPSKPLLQLSSYTKIIEILVDTKHEIAIGDTLLVQGIQSTVHTIFPVAQNYQLKLESHPFEIKMPSDVLLDVMIEKKSVSGTLVPAKALSYDGTSAYVMLYRNEIFEKHSVTVLGKDANEVLLQESLEQPIALVHASKLSQLLAYKTFTTHVVPHE
jgi:multidrug efflux pump subunit AcrA (membrane-fusion protein)